MQASPETLLLGARQTELFRANPMNTWNWRQSSIVVMLRAVVLVLYVHIFQNWLHWSVIVPERRTNSGRDRPKFDEFEPSWIEFSPYPVEIALGSAEVGPSSDERGLKQATMSRNLTKSAKSGLESTKLRPLGATAQIRAISL